MTIQELHDAKTKRKAEIETELGRVGKTLAQMRAYEQQLLGRLAEVEADMAMLTEKSSAPPQQDEVNDGN